MDERFGIPRFLHLEPEKLHAFLDQDKTILWHNTSFAAAENILRSNELWATDFRFLNEWTELQHALELSSGVFTGSLPWVDNMIDKLLPTKTQAPSTEILSFSREFNSLEQFRGYSHRSVGVALGFDEATFDQVAQNAGFEKMRCIYDSDTKEKALLALRGEKVSAIDYFKQRANDPSLSEVQRRHASKQPQYVMQNAVLDYLQLALSFKHPSFRREDEIRYISVPRGTYSLAPKAAKYVNKEPKRTYVQRGAAIKPISKIPLTVEDKPHPLKAILFGPMLQADAVRHSGNDREWFFSLLNTEKIGNQWHELQLVPIAFSNIPLRD